MPRITLAAVAAALLPMGAGGCASAIALDHAVMAYDSTTAQSVSKQLLLNIARARHNQPMHFTAISNIAATYKFSVSGGIGPAATGDRGGLIVPFAGAGLEENPTISISPMQGEEFTQRLLTPFEERKLTLLLRQGYDIDALLRLMVAEVLVEREGAGIVSVKHNRPSDRQGYAYFRRLVAHLSSIQDRHALHVEPLHFVYAWTVPAAEVTPEAFETTYKGFSLTYDPAANSYRVTKRVNGRVMITNYDPEVLSNEERFRLHEKAEEAPFNDILVDVRPGHRGGEFPMRGRMRLRSFHEMLTFIGRGLGEEREYHVPPDPRSPAIGENPPFTMELTETRRAPAGGLSVELHGLHYAVKPQAGYQWNKKVFSLLYQLFQMSVSTVVNTGPAITIAK
jgi:hypothetical protein